MGRNLLGGVRKMFGAGLLLCASDFKLFMIFVVFFFTSGGGEENIRAVLRLALRCGFKWFTIFSFYLSSLVR